HYPEWKVSADENNVHDDRALYEGLPADISDAGRAPRCGPQMRGVVEPHVRLGAESVHALPLEVETAISQGGDLLDERAFGRDRVMTGQTVADAGQPGPGSSRSAGVAHLCAREAFLDMCAVRKGKGLA